MKLENINKILFITLSNIGDVILTLPVLSALKQNFPGAKIDIAIGPRPKEIFIKDPRINRIFVYDKHASLREKMEFVKRLKKERYDLAVDLRRSILPILIGARMRTPLFLVNINRAKHKREIHLNKVKALGIDYTETRNIYIEDKDRGTIHRLLGERGVEKGDILIGISPSCRSLLKQWHTDRFIEVIRGLLKEGSYKIVLIGDVNQKDISQKIKDAVRHNNLVDLTGMTNLNELCALIDSLHILLTCDSACLHIACDLGVKVVAIFGPTDPEEYGSIGKDDIVIRKNLKCSPCNKARCSFGNGCMRDIDPEEVLAALRLSLQK
jgi:lipopolysaccharide heptosyltransferase II